MDQEVLSKAREWKHLHQGLEILGKDNLLRAIMSKFCVSSPLNSEITQGMLPLHWEPHVSAAPQKPTEQTCAEREERLGQGWSWSLLILLNRQIYFTFMGRMLVTIVSSFLKSYLVLCCHFWDNSLCSIAMILSIFIILVCLNAVSLPLCGLIIPFHSQSISWQQKVIFTTSLSADRAVLLRLYM